MYNSSIEMGSVMGIQSPCYDGLVACEQKEIAMFTLIINNTSVIFSKFFAVADREAVEVAIPADTRRAIFLDTGATPVLFETIAALSERGNEVVVRDHHRGEGRTPEAAEEIDNLLGERATIVLRADMPACAGLVEVGEFIGEGTVIVADPDPDGLTAAMKAVGVSYPELDADAAVLDGPRAGQTKGSLSPLALLLVRGLATLPAFNPKAPAVAEEAKSKLFAEFVAAVEGSLEARERLEERSVAYGETRFKASCLYADTVRKPAPGVILTDTVGREGYDLSSLVEFMELNCPRITVIRKDNGPIAAIHGVQYSLAVGQEYSGRVNLQELLPEGFESSPQAGIISNTTFLLHVSEEVWHGAVLPELRRRTPGRRVVMRTSLTSTVGHTGTEFPTSVPVEVLGIFEAEDHDEAWALVEEDPDNRTIFYFEEG